MIAIDKYLVSEDLLDEQFVCDLNKCKGACCVEGDEGAYLTEDEADTLDDIYEDVKEFLTPEGRAAIEEQGKYVLNTEGAMRTTLIDGKACAYIRYENGISFCGIERAWEKGEVDFRKPVSCHLYPVRTKDLGDYQAVNYETWEICADACVLGQSLKVPVYKYLKEPLIRALGEEFYNTLEAADAYRNSK